MKDFDGYDFIRQVNAKITLLLQDYSSFIVELKQIQARLVAGGIAVASPDFASENMYITRSINYIRQGVYKVAVMGPCNAGKSTLLNVLLGENLLPVNALPTTGIITSLIPGKHKVVGLYEKGNAPAFSVSRDRFWKDFTLSKTEIDTIAEHGHIVSRWQHIAYAQVECENAFLSHGIRLIDHPGLEVKTNYPVVSPNFLKQPDTVAIVVLNATNPFPRRVQEFINDLLGPRRRENVFFVINRVDQVAPEALPLLRKNVRLTLRQQMIDRNYYFDLDFYERRVFYTNAKLASGAHLSGGEEPGVAALERELEKYLTDHERLAKALEFILQILNYVTDRICDYITRARIALNEHKKGNALFAGEKERFDTIQHSLLEITFLARRIIAGEQTVLADSSSRAAPASDEEPSLAPPTEPPPVPLSERRTSGALRLKELDPVEVWMDIDDQLQFVAQVLERAEFPASLRTQLQEQFTLISSRRADQNLYMAVVGEFSSGKSTFINALLHQKLLKASVLPTTTTPTRLCYGPELNVTVRFKDRKKPLDYLSDTAQLWQLMRSMYPPSSQKEENIREFIHLITTQDSIAAQISRIEIQHPSSFLDEVVIIDTPGTNAESEHHALITSNIIEHEADAAVIVIPGPVPLARTLVEFLTEQLRPVLHRCLFVITQMDKIPADEQKVFMEDLSARLSKALQTEQRFTLYPSAPLIALQGLNEDAGEAEELWFWKERFSELEEVITNRLRHERTLSIAERLIRLLSRLFEQLVKHLSEQQQGYEMRKEAIQKDIIMREQQSSLEQLQQLQAVAQWDLKEIDRRRTALRTKQQKLAAIVV